MIKYEKVELDIGSAFLCIVLYLLITPRLLIKVMKTGEIDFIRL